MTSRSEIATPERSEFYRILKMLNTPSEKLVYSICFTNLIIGVDLAGMPKQDIHMHRRNLLPIFRLLYEDNGKSETWVRVAVKMADPGRLGIIEMFRQEVELHNEKSRNGGLVVPGNVVSGKFIKSARGRVNEMLREMGKEPI